nr:uncharacterized protein LOC111515503 [Leptinotarsa decemlineata]
MNGRSKRILELASQAYSLRNRKTVKYVEEESELSLNKFEASASSEDDVTFTPQGLLESSDSTYDSINEAGYVEITPEKLLKTKNTSLSTVSETGSVSNIIPRSIYSEYCIHESGGGVLVSEKVAEALCETQGSSDRMSGSPKELTMLRNVEWVSSPCKL